MKRPKPPVETAVDQAELADFLGVTVQRVSQLVSEGIAVRVGRGRYDLRETGKRYIQSLKTRQTGRILDPEEGGDGKPRSLEAAKLQKVLIETKRAQLAYDTDRGELVLKSEMKEAGVKLGAIVSATLQGKPSALAPLLAGKTEDDLQEILTTEITAILATLQSEIANAI